jgi:P4 family phage/plasmid primase-like protien
MATKKKTQQQLPYEVLRDYLERNRVVGPGTDWNITGMGKHDKGSYRVPDKDYEKFLKLVHDTIFGEPSSACGLLEKHLSHGGPVLIDLDFKYTAGSHLQRRFDDTQLRSFVLNYVLAMYRYFDMKPLGKPLRFFVLLKPSPEVAPAKHNKDAHIHKDGVHIICPDLTLDPKIQYTLRGYMLQMNTIQSVFDETGFTNSEQDVFDIAVISRNNWFLYGATKPDKAWYSVNSMFEVPTDLDLSALGEDARRETIDNAMTESDLGDFTEWDYTKLFSIRVGHEIVTPIKVIDDRKFEWEALYSKWSGGKNISANAPTPVALQITEDDDDENEGQDHFAVSPDATAAMAKASVEQQDDFDWGELSGGYTNEDIEQALELVDKCLNPNKRARDYGSWIDTGLCLYNINSAAKVPQDDKMCKRWANFSRRADGYEQTPDTVYEKAWRGFHKETTAKKIRIGSLHFWAEEDCPERYKEITERTAIGWVLQNPEGSHGKVADLMKRMYKHIFCSTIMGRKNQEYFQYVGNYWKKLKSNNELWIRLTRNIERLYSAALMECARLMHVAGDNTSTQKNAMEEAKAKMGAMAEKQKTLLKTKAQLESTPFIENVLKASFQKFYNDNFTDMLNQRKDIFACGNCVVELRHYDGSDMNLNKPRVYVRKGRPDDFISFVMGRENELEAISLDYDAKTGTLAPFDPNTPEQKELAKFFKLVFPRDDLREYVLTLLSACLEGENKEQKFYILRGGGSNGKSKLINLMSFVFGEYQTSLNTAALTRKRPESGAANPDIITLKSKRFIFMQEPDEGEKLNTARIKQFTGGDIVEARALFGDQEKFKIMGRIFFSTNDLPPVNSMDGGTWRRMEVLPFESTFKPHGHPEIDAAKHVYEQDNNLDDKFKQNSMRIAFLRLLLHYWETRYLVTGLSMPPDCVMEAVNKFKAENDSFIAFANETFIKETGATASITDIMPRYKMWMSLQSGRKLLKKPEIVERLGKMFKSSDGGLTYKDVRVACEGEDVSGNFVGGGGFR